MLVAVGVLLGVRVVVGLGVHIKNGFRGQQVRAGLVLVGKTGERTAGIA